METAITIIWLVIFVEAITEIIVASELFSPFREFIWNTRFTFLHKLFACGYCISVWVSASVAWIIPTHNGILGYFIKVMIIHRLSNMFHGIVTRLLGRDK